MRLAVVASPLSLITASTWSSALAQGAPSREAPVGPPPHVRLRLGHRRLTGS